MHVAWYYWILVLVSALVFGWICALIADRREYSGLGFGIVGFFAFLIIFVGTYSTGVALTS